MQSRTLICRINDFYLCINLENRGIYYDPEALISLKVNHIIKTYAQKKR